MTGKFQVTHPSGVLFPAVLAAADHTTISGKQLSTAYVAEYEVIARLCEVMNFDHYDNGWHATSTLAAQGLGEQSDVLEGKRGFTDLTAHGDDSRFELVMNKLSGPLAISGYSLSFKPYPCCGYTHRFIDCALDIRRQMKNSVPALASITASLPVVEWYRLS